jgi:hypothetical protein
VETSKESSLIKVETPGGRKLAEGKRVRHRRRRLGRLERDEGGFFLIIHFPY